MDSSNVVQFPDSTSRRVFSRRPREEIDLQDDPAPRSLSTTPAAVNARLRIERREAWRRAEAVVDYWKQRMKFEYALERAQRMGLPEGRSHGPIDDDRFSKVEKHRAAIVRQLLTPAPDAGAVKWKQAAFAGNDYLDVKPERVDRAIADDLAFLAAHPIRRSNRAEGHEAPAPIG